MANQRLYLAVQRLPVLGQGNWDQLIVAMREKGDNQNQNPSRRNHWRASVGGTIWIFEALFDTSIVDVEWFTNWLINLFGVNPENASVATGYNIYGRFATFAYLGTNQFRIGVFGFIEDQGYPGYADSHAAALLYIFDNAEDW